MTSPLALRIIIATDDSDLLTAATATAICWLGARCWLPSTPSSLMALGHAAFATSAHDDGTEGEALLNHTNLSTAEDDDPSLVESMTARVRTFLSANKSFTDRSGESSELALENLRDPHDLDDTNLRAQGHEAALQRSFSPLAAVGLAFRYDAPANSDFSTPALTWLCSITNSWVGYLSNFGQNLTYGGPQSVVFGLLVATAVQWTITLGLSEVASAFPSAGVELVMPRDSDCSDEMAGTVPLHIYSSANQAQEVRSLRCGLDDLIRLVGYHLLWFISMCSVRCGTHQLLAQ